MEIKSEKIGPNMHLVSLFGRMDVQGTDDVDFELSVLSNSIKADLLVDLSGVSFLASTGIRTLLSVARAQVKRGDKMVFVAPQAPVKHTLVVTGVETQIPIFDDTQAAINHLKQP